VSLVAAETTDRLFDRSSDRVADQLRRMIISLDLAPGSLLIESELVGQLGCSRTPLREALLRLHRENLVVALPRRAMSVAEISIFDLRQVYEARCEIETATARMAAERMSEPALEAVGDVVARLGALRPDTPAFEITTLDMAFHRCLVEGSRNRYLADAFACLVGPAQRLSVVSYARGVQLRPTVEEHGYICEALVRRDADAAAARMAEHISKAKDRILRVL
jgi:DNA-binding GntR family transcriptional regulator